jgi:hypothetical protein
MISLDFNNGDVIDEYDFDDVGFIPRQFLSLSHHQILASLDDQGQLKLLIPNQESISMFDLPDYETTHFAYLSRSVLAGGKSPMHGFIAHTTDDDLLDLLITVDFMDNDLYAKVTPVPRDEFKVLYIPHATDLFQLDFITRLVFTHSGNYILEFRDWVDGKSLKTHSLDFKEMEDTEIIDGVILFSTDAKKKGWIKWTFLGWTRHHTIVSFSHEESDEFIDWVGAEDLPFDEEILHFEL